MFWPAVLRSCAARGLLTSRRCFLVGGGLRLRGAVALECLAQGLSELMAACRR